MARDMVPVLKRCRALGIEPMVMGLDKKSNRTAGNSRRKISEYGAQLREKQKAKFRSEERFSRNAETDL